MVYRKEGVEGEEWPAFTTCINWRRFVFVGCRYSHFLKIMTECTLAVSPAPR